MSLGSRNHILAIVVSAAIAVLVIITVWQSGGARGPMHLASHSGEVEEEPSGAAIDQQAPGVRRKVDRERGARADEDSALRGGAESQVSGVLVDHLGEPIGGVRYGVSSGISADVESEWGSVGERVTGSDGGWVVEPVEQGAIIIELHYGMQVRVDLSSINPDGVIRLERLGTVRMRISGVAEGEGMASVGPMHDPEKGVYDSATGIIRTRLVDGMVYVLRSSYIKIPRSGIQVYAFSDLEYVASAHADGVELEQSIARGFPSFELSAFAVGEHPRFGVRVVGESGGISEVDGTVYAYRSGAIQNYELKGGCAELNDSGQFMPEEGQVSVRLDDGVLIRTSFRRSDLSAEGLLILRRADGVEPVELRFDHSVNVNDLFMYTRGSGDNWRRAYGAMGAEEGGGMFVRAGDDENSLWLYGESGEVPSEVLVIEKYGAVYREVVRGGGFDRSVLVQMRPLPVLKTIDIGEALLSRVVGEFDSYLLRLEWQNLKGDWIPLYGFGFKSESDEVRIALPGGLGMRCRASGRGGRDPRTWVVLGESH